MNDSDISACERDYAERLDRAERLALRAGQIIRDDKALAELANNANLDIWGQLARLMREHDKARGGDPVAREAVFTALDQIDKELSNTAYEFARRWEE